MRIIDGKRVLFESADVAKFKAVWPCSNLGTGPYWFEFDWRGDLVGTNVPEEHDGPAASALADDGRAFLSTTGAIKPEWI